MARKQLPAAVQATYGRRRAAPIRAVYSTRRGGTLHCPPRPPGFFQVRRHVVAAGRLAAVSRDDLLRITPAAVAAGMPLPAPLWNAVAGAWSAHPPKATTTAVVGNLVVRAPSAPDLAALLLAHGWRRQRSGRLHPPRSGLPPRVPWSHRTVRPSARLVLARVVAWAIARREVYGEG